MPRAMCCAATAPPYVDPSAEEGVPPPSAAADVLSKELATLKISALQKRAAAEGVDAARVEEAVDSDEAKPDLIALIVEAVVASGGEADEQAKVVAALKEELATLKISALQKRAASEGVDAGRVEEAVDGDEAKPDLIALIIEVVSAAKTAAKTRSEAQSDGKRLTMAELGLSSEDDCDTSSNSPDESLRGELDPMSLKQVRARAVALGVDAERLEVARDQDDAKAAIIALILEHNRLNPNAIVPQQPATVQEVVPTPKPADRSQRQKGSVGNRSKRERSSLPMKAHSGTGGSSSRSFGSSGGKKPQESNKSSRAQRSSSLTRTNDRPAMASSRDSFLPLGKHAMLSYCWDDQEKVKLARTALAARGVECWMVSRPRQRLRADQFNLPYARRT